MELVFSDEFETPGRSFYPGDDPYWEAVDLHNWATNDLEWYALRSFYTRWMTDVFCQRSKGMIPQL